MDLYIRDLVKSYDDKIVLNIEQLYLKKSKCYGIIGPNGAGKSTLLKILAGLEEKNDGIIQYNKESLTGALQKKITYLSQSPYLLKTSVYTNVAYPLKIRKLSETIIEEKVTEILKELKIYELRNQLATSLSGGESQKVVLARALVFEPELLLLDEPTANIDPQTIEVIEQAILKRNNQNKMTTITITHNMGQVHRMCDEVIYIEKGKVIDQGDSEKVLSNPLNPFVKYYL